MNVSQTLFFVQSYVYGNIIQKDKISIVTLRIYIFF